MPTDGTRAFRDFTIASTATGKTAMTNSKKLNAKQKQTLAAIRDGKEPYHLFTTRGAYSAAMRALTARGLVTYATDADGHTRPMLTDAGRVAITPKLVKRSPGAVEVEALVACSTCHVAIGEPCHLDEPDGSKGPVSPNAHCTRYDAARIERARLVEEAKPHCARCGDSRNTSSKEGVILCSFCHAAGPVGPKPLTYATAPNLSWAPEVIADGSGKWCGNALRFATKEEATQNVLNLSWRWLLVRDTRVVESLDPVNYRWTETGLVAVEPTPVTP